VVPLHEHIIAQGFLEMVREVDKRALLYSDEEPRRVSADPLNPSRSRAGNTRGDLAEWVREIGVTDKELHGGTRSNRLLSGWDHREGPRRNHGSCASK